MQLQMVLNSRVGGSHIKMDLEAIVLFLFKNTFQAGSRHINSVGGLFLEILDVGWGVTPFSPLNSCQRREHYQWNRMKLPCRDYSLFHFGLCFSHNMTINEDSYSKIKSSQYLRGIRNSQYTFYRFSMNSLLRIITK